uniref:Uncharacterized protein n=1 Tax=Branchiostoma floridae TaxID=7739 RepID=C3Z4U2_BRAFL|eukprot:XP_002596287.1 hypothetical protein BRAFLDRAFT_82120 [Branchiostoma floridae]
MAIWGMSLFLKGVKKQSACHLSFSSLDLCGPTNTGSSWKTMLGRLQQTVSYSGANGKGRKTMEREVCSICTDPGARDVRQKIREIASHLGAIPGRGEGRNESIGLKTSSPKHRHRLCDLVLIGPFSSYQIQKKLNLLDKGGNQPYTCCGQDSCSPPRPPTSTHHSGLPDMHINQQDP